jgi:hypothetical protein
VICPIHPHVKQLDGREGLIGIPDQYSYKLSATGGNSQKYGSCQVCGKYATEVFMQWQSKYYFSPAYGIGGWTYSGCVVLFGHEQCLRTRRPLMAPPYVKETRRRGSYYPQLQRVASARLSA